MAARRLSIFIAILLSALCEGSGGGGNASEKINFLKDFVPQIKGVSFLNAFTCWDGASDVKLIKEMSKNGIFIGVHRECSSVEHFFDHRSSFVLDMSCPFAESCLEMASSTKLFGTERKWILLDDERVQGTERRELEKYIVGRWTSRLKGLDVLTDSDTTVVIENEVNGNFVLVNVYKRRTDTPILTEDLGYWHRDRGLHLNRAPNERALFAKRLNLDRTPIRASVVLLENDSRNHLDDYVDAHVDAVSKLNYILTLRLVDFVNASPEFTFVDTWGYQRENGSWTGMVGDMVSGGADIGGTPLFFSAARMKHLEYISMTTPSTITFAFRQPPLSYITNIFLLPFRWTVWSATGGLVLLTSAVLYIAARSNEKILHSEPSTEISGRWSDVCLLTLGAVAQQGSSKDLRLISGRITIVVTFITLMFLYVSYSANIVALLQSQSEGIKTLSDLYNSRMKLGAEDTPYNRYYIPKFNDSLRRAIWMNKLSNKGENPQFRSTAEGVARMRQGLYAFHMEVGAGYKLISETFLEHEKCGLYEIQLLDIVDPWYSIKKHTPFREMFKVGMRRIQESGLQHREMWRIYQKKPVCSSKGGFLSVGLVEIRPAIIWLCSGAAFALAVFIAERIFIIVRMRKKGEDNEIDDGIVQE